MFLSAGFYFFVVFVAAAKIVSLILILLIRNDPHVINLLQAATVAGQISFLLEINELMQTFNLGVTKIAHGGFDHGLFECWES